MRLRLLCVPLFVLLVLTAGPPAAAQYLHPKVSGKEINIRNVIVLPARVEIVRQSMKGPEGMAAESDLLSARVTRLVIEAFAAKNVKAPANISTDGADAASTSAGSALTDNSEAETQRRYLLADIQARYDSLLPRIEKKRKDVKKGRFSMGDEVVNLNLDKSIDAIVFVRGQGQKLSKGKSTFSLLTLTLDLPYVLMTIGVVDAHTGEVLLFADPKAITDATKENDKPLRKAIEKSLKKLPPAL